MIRTDRMRPKDYVMPADMPVERSGVTAIVESPAEMAEHRERASKASGKVLRQKAQAIKRGRLARWSWTEGCEADYLAMRRESVA